MGDEDYGREVRNYYASPFIHIISNTSPGLKYAGDYPDGKTQRREARRRERRRKKGRL